MKDFIIVQKLTIRGTLGKIKYIPRLLLHLLIYSFVFLGASRILSGLGFAGGIILYLIKGCLFSHLLYTLLYIRMDQSIDYRRTKEAFLAYLSPAITAFFTYYIIELVFNLIFSELIIGGLGMNRANLLGFLFGTVIFLIYSAVAENIYISRAYSYDSIYNSLDFIKLNPINWILVMLIIYLPLKIFFAVDLDVFKSFGTIETVDLIMIMSNQLLMAVFLIYKGELYSVLKDSSKRKREFEINK